ncbi:DinB family protein [Streptomyces griseocarneus]|uniref:DinB family protein n=1 Tax=Streptomyces griseocarneus TaxID=51201 RepID=UPI00167C6122|nr:DinB family protein [Streptomyces griseocarneus]MBZ6477655.1 DinB family protein [Streptomyces griseocarneus]
MPTHVVEKNVADERGTLLDFLDAQRGGIRRSVLGLTDEQADATPSASELSLRALLKHAVDGERSWVDRARGLAPENFEESMAQWQAGWRPTEDETVAALLARWDEVAADTERFVLSVNLEDTFPLPDAPWFPQASSVSVRWLLLHLIEEIARHAGHADIVRESLDGKTAFELLAEQQAG